MWEDIFVKCLCQKIVTTERHKVKIVKDDFYHNSVHPFASQVSKNALLVGCYREPAQSFGCCKNVFY